MSESQEITRTEENAPERVSQRRYVAPPVDVYENEEEILVVADMPGVAKGDLSVDFDNDRLTIEATRRPAEDTTWLFREHADADYRRSFEVAPGIDVEKVTADLKAGVLTVHLPKASELKPRRIPISAS